MSYIHITTTIDSEKKARVIVNELVERKLVACAQVIQPIESTYWWKGNIETSKEWLIIMKTHERHFDDVQLTIKKLHTYDNPEIIVIF